MIRPATDVSPRDLFRTLFRHKVKVAVAFAVCLLGMLAARLLAPTTYRSECKLLVRLGRENASVDPTVKMGEAPVVAAPQPREDEINSIKQILTSRVLMERLVDHFGPEALLEGMQVAGQTPPVKSDAASNPQTNDVGLQGESASRDEVLDVASLQRRLAPPVKERELALEEVAKKLEVQEIKKSNVITLSFKARDPRFAQAVLARFVEIYLDHHLKMHRNPAANHFFSAQAEAIKDKIQATSAELRELKNSTGVASIEEQRRLVLARIGGLREQRATAEAELTAAEANIAFLTKSLRELPQQVETARVSGFSGPGASLRHQMESLQQQETAALAKPGEPRLSLEEIRRRQQRVSEATAGLGPSNVQVTSGVNRVYEEARLALFNEQAKATTLKARVAVFTEQLDEAQKELKSLNNHEVRLASLERELELQEVNYRTYAEGLEQTRIDEALKLERISNIVVAEPPTLEDRALGRSLKFTLALGMAMGLVSGVGLAFGSERLDQSIKTTAEAEERLDLPVLVSIPRMSSSRVRLRRA